jgi:hypothetical protein
MTVDLSAPARRSQGFAAIGQPTTTHCQHQAGLSVALHSNQAKTFPAVCDTSAIHEIL